MAKAPATSKVAIQDLRTGDIMIDPEGNDARVIRVMWINHERGRLSTDLGVAVRPLNEKVTVRLPRPA